MDEPPKRLAVGSLVDDYEFVLYSFKNTDQQLPIMFMHIAPLLQALWQAVPNCRCSEFPRLTCTRDLAKTKSCPYPLRSEFLD